MERATIAFEEKRYDAVVNECTKLLKRGNVKVLDLRCQALARLGKHDLALEDARHMIRTNRRHATGYLRASQLERACGNLTAATKWLEHGIKNVSNRDVFEEQMRKVQQLVRMGKRRDPLAVPLEVLELILSYLDYDEIIRLLSVSKVWRDVLCRVQPLTTTVDFGRTRRTVSSVACNAAFRRLRKPKKIVLVRLGETAIKLCHAWLAKFTHLETLETLELQEIRIDTIRFDKLFKIKRLHVGQTSMTTAFKIIGSCSSLEDFRIENGTGGIVVEHMHERLRKLQLHSTTTLPTPNIDNFPNLEQLFLSGFNFQELDLSGHHLYVLSISTKSHVRLKLPESLQELKLMDMSGGNFEIQAGKLPNLQTLRMKGVSLSVLEANPQRMMIEDPGNIVIVKPFVGCTELWLQSENVKDEDSTLLGELFPAVECLTLSLPRVSGVFVSRFMSKHIRKVVLKDCVKMSTDVSEWLKSKGINCQVINSSHSSSHERRVRIST